MTKGAIFILTSVITAGIASSYSLGARALIYGRNAYARVSQMTVKQIVQTSGKAYLKKKGSEYAIDATRSVSYQYVVEKRINLITVLMDTFIQPYIGEFVGNALFVGFDFNRNNEFFRAASIFEDGVSIKEFSAFMIKSSIKAVINGKLGMDKEILRSFGMIGGVPTDVVLHNFVLEIGNQIEN